MIELEHMFEDKCYAEGVVEEEKLPRNDVWRRIPWNRYPQKYYIKIILN